MEKYLNSKILIVDDEPANVFLLKGVLEGEGYKTIFAYEGKTAVELMRKEEPDVVLLDMMMPGISGLDLLKITRNMKDISDIPIIIVSARGELEDVEEGLNYGAVDYIKKPVYNIELLARLRASLRLAKKILELKKAKAEMEETNALLEVLSEKDGLTSVYNRRVFDARISESWKVAFREKRNIALIMIDIDHFKVYNDNFGHVMGDKCLISISLEMQKNLLRPADILCRYGGEEFVVILHETDASGALLVAEKLRKAVESLGIEFYREDKKEVVTISLGIASVIPGKDNKVDDFINDADQALYRAKKAGRNRSVVWRCEE